MSIACFTNMLRLPISSTSNIIHYNMFVKLVEARARTALIIKSFCRNGPWQWQNGKSKKLFVNGNDYRL